MFLRHITLQIVDNIFLCLNIICIYSLLSFAFNPLELFFLLVKTKLKSVTLFKRFRRRSFVKNNFISYYVMMYLCILAGLSSPGARQYDASGDTGDDVDSIIPAPPLLSTSPPCFIYTVWEQDIFFSSIKMLISSKILFYWTLDLFVA